MGNLNDLAEAFAESKPEASPFVESILEKSDPNGDAFIDGVSSDGSATVYGEVPSSVSIPIPGVSSSAGISEQTFDPEIHAVDAAGNPKRNVDGTLAKKRGRKKGSFGSNGHASPIDTTQATAELQYKNAAIVTVQTIVILGYSIGGKDEWEPEAGELFAMNEAWTAYYKARGITDIPAWIGVLIATGAYAAPRLAKPKTSERLSAVWKGLKSPLTKVGKWLRLW